MEVKYFGKAECCACKVRGVSDATIKGKYLFDAPCYLLEGSWGPMCRNCYNEYGKKGVGQQYKRNEDGEFIKYKELSNRQKTSKPLSELNLEFAANMLGISVEEIM